jgi:hypothetical protein
MDSDPQDVPGSPDLAATIFQKIEKAVLFQADVTHEQTQAQWHEG